MSNRRAAWRKDPCAFITEVLRDPETGRAFELYQAQQRFLREALVLAKDGRLPYPELIFACPKKSGKRRRPQWLPSMSLWCSADRMQRPTASRTTSIMRKVAFFRPSVA